MWFCSPAFGLMRRVRAANEVMSGTRGKSDLVLAWHLRGDLMYSLVLPYSHECLLALEETRANVCCPRLQLHLSWESLYYSPRAANHNAAALAWDLTWKGSRRSFHQAHLKAAGRGAEPVHTLSFSISFQHSMCSKVDEQMSFMPKSTSGY